MLNADTAACSVHSRRVEHESRTGTGHGRAWTSDGNPRSGPTKVRKLDRWTPSASLPDRHSGGGHHVYAQRRLCSMLEAH